MRGFIMCVALAGIYFPVAVLVKAHRRSPGGIVMAKTLAKLTIGIAALAAATWFGTSSSRASGDAPWCAVINIGVGTVYWDCQYPTFEACYHLGNIRLNLTLAASQYSPRSAAHLSVLRVALPVFVRDYLRWSGPRVQITKATIAASWRQ